MTIYDPSAPDGLYAAVRSLLLASPVGVADSHPVRAPEGAAMPYLVYWFPANAPHWSTGPGHHEVARLQVSIFGDDFDAVFAIGEAAKGLLDRESMFIKYGHIAKFFRVNDFVDEPSQSRSPGGDRVFRCVVEFDVTVSLTS